VRRLIISSLKCVSNRNAVYGSMEPPVSSCSFRHGVGMNIYKRFLKGIYKMGKIYNNKDECVGRVEKFNNIYRVYDSESGYTVVGRIEPDGYVWNGDSGSGYRVGLIKNGKIYNESGERCLGHVASGQIYNTEYYNDNARVGYVKGGDDIFSGAAGLLRLNDKLTAVESKAQTATESDTHDDDSWFGKLKYDDRWWVKLIFHIIVLLGHFFKGPFVEFRWIHLEADRKEWWITCIRSVFLSFVFFFVVGLVVFSIFDESGIVQGIVAVVFVLTLAAFGVLPIIFVSIRRMHDIGKSGWWIIAPLVNFVMCGFFPGKIEGNKYV